MAESNPLLALLSAWHSLVCPHRAFKCPARMCVVSFVVYDKNIYEFQEHKQKNRSFYDFGVR